MANDNIIKSVTFTRILKKQKKHSIHGEQYDLLKLG